MTGGRIMSVRSTVFDPRKLTDTSATSADSRSSLRAAIAPSAANSTIASTVRSITLRGSLFGSYGPATAGRAITSTPTSTDRNVPSGAMPLI